ncbi:MAG: hypothetical protein ABSF69_10775 [Polyangiaceae bacterium]
MPSARLRRRALRASLSGAMIALCSPAQASDAPSAAELNSARELFTDAERDEDAGRWQEALDKLRRVAHVKQTAGVRYHVALCEERLGFLAEAWEDYRSAQAQATGEGANDVLRLVGPVLGTLGPRVPHLAIHIVPDSADATVTVDGAPLARSSLGDPTPINPGLHRIEAAAAGRTTVRTTVSLREGDSTVFDIALVEVVPPIATGPSVPIRAPAPDVPAFGGAAAGATTAASAGLAAFGVVAFVVAGTVRGGAIRQCRSLASANPDACEGLKNGVRAWDWTAAAAWGAAGVSGIVAAVLWSRPSRHATSSGRLLVGPTSIGVAGSF